jgi:hypothetical protein
LHSRFYFLSRLSSPKKSNASTFLKTAARKSFTLKDLTPTIGRGFAKLKEMNA